MPKKQKPEAAVQKAIMDYLKAEGHLRFRMNTGVLKNAAGRPVKFGVKGMADILAFIGSIEIRPLWIECKAPGKKPTDDQFDFKKLVESHGHDYIVADKLETVKEWLDEN